MLAIPHSGNECSGLCQTPCHHEGCWQCFEKEYQVPASGSTADMEATRKVLKMGKLKPMTELEAREVLANTREAAAQKLRERRAFARSNARSASARSVLAGVSKQTPEQHQTAIITRETLEALVAKAGLSVNWNDGNPIFSENPRWDDSRARNYEARIAELQMQAETERTKRQRAERQLQAAQKKLSDLGQGPSVVERVSDAIVQRAMAAQEASITAALNDSTSIFRAMEEEARDRLRETGASEADIAAAERLLGKPPLQFADDISTLKVGYYLHPVWKSIASVKVVTVTDV